MRRLAALAPSLRSIGLPPSASLPAGARALLAGAERSSELALHAVRGVLFLAVGVATAATVQVPWLLLPALPVILVAFWLAIARVLRRGGPAWLPYLLTILDGWIVIRTTITLFGPARTLIQPMMGFSGVSFSGGATDVVIWTPPLLVYIALSGALRINPRLAAFSTAVALFAFLLFAAALALPVGQTLVVALIIAVSGLVGIYAARNFRYTAFKAQEEAVLERFVPASLTRDLAQTGVVERAGRLEEVTILLADIRGFTRRSEQMAPPEVVAFLNEYLAAVVPPLLAAGAVVDKYIGDGILAFFEGKDHAAAAVRAARSLLTTVDAFNATRPGLEPVRVGVALHTGSAMIGSIGAAARREYTLISDAVNVAARLEELNKRFGSCVVASEATIRAARLVDDTDRQGFIGPEAVELRGHAATLAVYHLPAPWPLP